MPRLFLNWSSHKGTAIFASSFNNSIVSPFRPNQISSLHQVLKQSLTEWIERKASYLKQLALGLMTTSDLFRVSAVGFCRSVIPYSKSETGLAFNVSFKPSPGLSKCAERGFAI